MREFLAKHLYLSAVIIVTLIIFGASIAIKNQQEKVLGIKKEIRTPISSITPPPQPTNTPSSTPIIEIKQKKSSVLLSNPTNTPIVQRPNAMPTQEVRHILITPTPTPTSTPSPFVFPTSIPTSTPIPTPTPFFSQEIENALSQLDQILTNIENKPVAMNVIEGKRQRAYQDWVNSNQSIYATITVTIYKGRLNAILIAHGLNYFVIQ